MNDSGRTRVPANRPGRGTSAGARNLGRVLVCLALLGICLDPIPIRAQGMPGGGVGYNAVVAKLLADFPAFSASVETLMTNKTDNTRLSVPMGMAKRGEILRVDVDLSRMSGSGVSLDQISAMQNIGLAKMAMLVNPGERVMTVLFPDSKFSTQVAMSPTDVMDPRVKVTKRQSGKDNFAGQPVLRQLVTMAGADGKKTEATTWENPALSGFPVRIAFKQEGTSVVMNFTGTILDSGAEERFAVPADYKKFESMPALMNEARTKRIEGR